MLNARIRQCKRFLILWIYVNFGDVLVKNSWGAILAPSREMFENNTLYVAGKSYYCSLN